MMNGFVGMRLMWPSSVVVAVPVCRPARPRKGASIVSGAHNA